MPRTKYHELIVPQSPSLPRSLAGMSIVSDHVGSDGRRHLFLIRADEQEPVGERPKPRPKSERKPRQQRQAKVHLPAPASAPEPSPALAFPGAEVKGA